ncbi:hypothetical protein BH18ACT12_BH18ACT12_13020 [soil metagenome]
MFRASLAFDKGSGEYLKANRRWVRDLLVGADQLQNLVPGYSEQFATTLVQRVK